MEEVVLDKETRAMIISIERKRAELANQIKMILNTVLNTKGLTGNYMPSDTYEKLILKDETE